MERCPLVLIFRYWNIYTFQMNKTTHLTGGDLIDADLEGIIGFLVLLN